MTEDEFKAQYLTNYRVPQRIQDLEERLKIYYAQTALETNPKTVATFYRNFKLWCTAGGYTQEEVNRVKRYVQSVY